MDTQAYAFLLICVMFKFTKKKVRKVTMKVLEGLLLCLMILMTIITKRKKKKKQEPTKFSNLRTRYSEVNVEFFTATPYYVKYVNFHMNKF